MPKVTRLYAGDLMREMGPVVYYIRVGTLVKIGYTADLAQRIRKFNRDDCQLLAWRTGGSLGMERAIHARLHRSLAKGREWFIPSAEVMAEVRDARVACGIAKYAND